MARKGFVKAIFVFLSIFLFAAGNVYCADVADGDVNGDGVVSVHDAVKLLKIVVGSQEQTEVDKAHGNVAPLKELASPGEYQSAPDEELRIGDAVVVMRAAAEQVAWEGMAPVSTQNIILTIQASSADNGTIEPSGSISVEDGDRQTFTLTPAEGYVPDQVTLDGAPVEAAKIMSNGDGTYAYVLTATADHVVVASFKEAPSGHTVTASAGDHGAIEPAGEFTVENGASQTFTVTPEEGYAVFSFTVNGEEKELTADNQFTVENIEQNITVTVQFVEVLAIALPILENGTIEGPSTSAIGEIQTFTLKPAEGFTVYQVTVKGNPVVVKDDNTFEYEVTEEIKAEDIVVEFKTAYTITVPENLEHGAITPAGTIMVAEGLEKKFTATPEEGYAVDQVLVDGEPVAVAGDNTFVVTVAGNHEVGASFVKGLTIQASAGENGAIEPSGEVSVKDGYENTFTLTPAEGFEPAEVTVDGAAVDAAEITSNGDGTYSYILTATEDHVVVASFKEAPQCPPDTSGMVDLSEAGDDQAGIVVTWKNEDDGNNYSVKAFASSYEPKNQLAIPQNVKLRFESSETVDVFVTVGGEYKKADAPENIIFVIYGQNGDALGYFHAENFEEIDFSDWLGMVPCNATI